MALAAILEGAAVLALTAASSVPAAAQWDSIHQFQRRQYQRMQEQGGGFFGLFGGWGQQQREPTRRYRPNPQPQRQVDYSRAPAPRKKEATPDPNKPITTIVVMGGSMADWLAYGLEDAFSDSPNVEIVRKDQPHSGLLRYKYKSDLDWWHVARDDLAQQKANYVVMMLGVTDRQNIRESDAAKEAEQEAPKAAPAQPGAGGAAKGVEAGQGKEAKTPPKAAHGVIPFRSDQWARIYGRRIDKTIAALKSRGVPVFWVGLPSIRGTRSTADAVYLNNLYRARAERAGIVYIDVWDGFVDDAGKYSSYGPDYEGQIRRLRSSDGVFFTKYGARKLAHYVEREIRRYMSNRVTTLTFPTGPLGPGAGAGQSAVRPLAGPVLPLTGTVGQSSVLLGGANMRPAREDAVASKVLVKGDAVSAPPGRADDFKWPPDSKEYGKPPEPPPTVDKTSKAGPAAAAPAASVTSSPAVANNPPPAATPQTTAPLAIAPPAQRATAPAAVQPAAAAQAKAEAEAKAKAKAKAEEARAKAEAEAKKQAEARRRAAERARAEAQRSSGQRREWFRPPGRIETQRRPQRRSNDPLGGLFDFLPR